ncbi:hypothetical protein B0A50_05380 [Salinomyces thailandicus]|uniref:Uncharacterized protein n=1 Tax=Salinomyces thailandicus TaxID=706561 RepID=A0A4V5N4D4_9PEZI|nr:hypothetical protein B0A50_05380 [Salinomyces thailandica]
MVLGPSLETLQAIQTSPAEEQAAALRDIKNDIVGHDQRKEVAVKHGIVDVLVEILAAGNSRDGLRAGEAGTDGVSLRDTQSCSHGDDARLQALLILGSLASGGPAFVQPLTAAGAHKVLLDVLTTSTAPRLVTATLQALKLLASSCSQARDGLDDESFRSLDLFTAESANAFRNVLRQPSASTAARQQLRCATDIIATSATDEGTKAQLFSSDLLDSLSSLLASYAIQQKHVEYHGSPSAFLPPPPSNAIPGILAAITTMISGSTYRVHRFFLSQPIRDLFLQSWPGSGDQRHLLGPRFGFASHAVGEPLLPPLHVPVHGTTTYYGTPRTFPGLTHLQPPERRRGILESSNMPLGDPDHANAVCGWLIVLARSMQGHERLIALRLLALVSNAIDDDVASVGHRSEHVQKTREREKQIALLAVPIAVRLIETANEAKPASSLSAKEQQDARLVKEEACDVLALLIRYCKDLQVAGVDAGAIKHICPILKKSFDNMPLTKPMWSAKPATPDEADAAQTRRMGVRGLPSEILHAMRCRQGALEALAAIAAKEDLHRKAIIEAGVVTCIIDSLKPYPPDYSEKLAQNRGQAGPKDGNTTAVILAACHLAKTMSRSVSLLRTSLIDAGIAKPIFQLLSHQNPRVQLAATDVCINLVTDFSPMREDLVAEGVIKPLAEHARSSSPALRLSSLWALKHLVSKASKEVKIKALDELGAGWLASAIQGEHAPASIAPSGGGVSVGLSTPNAAGEQVDLLNPSNMDLDEPVAEQESADDDEDGEVMYDESSSTHYQSSQLRSTIDRRQQSFNSSKYLSSVRDQEQNPTLQARRDDLAVQEQALDFIRNLIGPEDGVLMVEHLMTQIGSAKLFEILIAKLSPLPASARLAGTNSGSNSRQVYNPTQIILSCIHIVNHLSNAASIHKQLVIAQKPLLQAWLPHFNHVDRHVRVFCVWAVNSLTWIEDDSDRREARQRALELRAVGIENAVRNMAHDADLDVRERVKTAMRQLETLL